MCYVVHSTINQAFARMSIPSPQHRILLIITGGIAAYKCLELIRRARDRGIAVRCVMTKAAQQFITPLSVGALTNDRVFTDLFDQEYLAGGAVVSASAAVERAGRER